MHFTSAGVTTALEEAEGEVFKKEKERKKKKEEEKKPIVWRARERGAARVACLVEGHYYYIAVV